VIAALWATVEVMLVQEIVELTAVQQHGELLAAMQDVDQHVDLAAVMLGVQQHVELEAVK